MLKTKPNRIHKIKSNQGFTLIEIMLASGLMLVVMGLTMNFLFGFNRSGNEMIVQATLEEALRTSLNRLDREIMEGSEVLASFNGDTSGAHTLILSVPFYSDDGFIVVDDTTGEPISDTLIIKSQSDPTQSMLGLNRTPAVYPDRLVLSIVPHAKSQRAALTNQVIAKNLMPKDGTNYDLPDNLGSAGISTVVTPTFIYYNTLGQPRSPAIESERTEIAQIKLVLWGELNQGKRLISARKEVDVRMRNWKDD